MLVVAGGSGLLGVGSSLEKWSLLRDSFRERIHVLGNVVMGVWDVGWRDRLRARTGALSVKNAGCLKLWDYLFPFPRNVQKSREGSWAVTEAGGVSTSHGGHALPSINPVANRFPIGILHLVWAVWVQDVLGSRNHQGYVSVDCSTPTCWRPCPSGFSVVLAYSWPRLRCCLDVPI
jgi:hypothetical protein